jgi:uncharacterized protein YjbI with pentapeptide repeats
MANPEHLQILQQGVERWNAWWWNQPRDVRADLSGANLAGANLLKAQFYDTDLSGANLSGANLNGANLNNAHLVSINFTRATLTSAALMHADLHQADFTQANLREANLTNARLTRANLTSARLTRASLHLVNLTDAILSRADLSNSILYETVFSNTNLAAVRGLETCDHAGPSPLDYRTLARSGLLPLVFLRGCGLPDTLIDYLPSLLNQPCHFYSCFISYASKDHAFAERLHADLQNKGVRCWFAPEDLKIGDRLRPRIDETIRLYDKLLLVLSKTSVASQWVEQEVETALAQERQQGTTILFPVRIDNTIMTLETGWPTLIRNTRNIGDFRRWKTHDVYQKAFDRLLRDLKAADHKPDGIV